MIYCSADKKAINDRYKKKNETEEIGEELAATLEEEGKSAESKFEEFQHSIASYYEGFQAVTFKTDDSKETTISNVRNLFSAQVVLVNHERRLQVDTACSNIAIKFNMLYLSVHQLIKEHI